MTTRSVASAVLLAVGVLLLSSVCAPCFAQEANAPPRDAMQDGVAKIESYRKEFDLANAEANRHYGYGNARQTLKKAFQTAGYSDPHDYSTAWGDTIYLVFFHRPSSRALLDASPLDDSIAYARESKALDAGALATLETQMGQWREKRRALFECMDGQIRSTAEGMALYEKAEREPDVAKRAAIEAEARRVCQEAERMKAEVPGRLAEQPVKSLRKPVTQAPRWVPAGEKTWVLLDHDQKFDSGIETIVGRGEHAVDGAKDAPAKVAEAIKAIKEILKRLGLGRTPGRIALEYAQKLAEAGDAITQYGGQIQEHMNRHPANMQAWCSIPTRTVVLKWEREEEWKDGRWVPTGRFRNLLPKEADRVLHTGQIRQTWEATEKNFPGKMQSFLQGHGNRLAVDEEEYSAYLARLDRGEDPTGARPGPAPAPAPSPADAEAQRLRQAEKALILEQIAAKEKLAAEGRDELARVDAEIERRMPEVRAELAAAQEATKKAVEVSKQAKLKWQNYADSGAAKAKVDQLEASWKAAETALAAARSREENLEREWKDLAGGGRRFEVAARVAKVDEELRALRHDLDVVEQQIRSLGTR